MKHQLNTKSIIATLLLASLAGCASHPQGERAAGAPEPASAPEPAEPSAFAARTDMPPRRIAVVAARYEPVIMHSNEEAIGSVSTPVVSDPVARGAVGGAAMGALAVVLLPLAAGPVGVLIIPAMLPVGVAVGVVAGAVSGAVNQQRIGSLPTRHHVSDQGLRGVNLQERVAARVVTTAPGAEHYRLETVPDAGPTAPGEPLDYEALKAAGYDGVLELSVTHIGYAVANGKSAMEARLVARAVSLDDGDANRTSRHEFTGHGLYGRDREADLDIVEGQLAWQVIEYVFTVAKAE